MLMLCIIESQQDYRTIESCVNIRQYFVKLVIILCVYGCVGFTVT